MEVAVSAARWVVGKALAPVTDGFLESWAASAGLGPNIDELKMQLLFAQGMLDNAEGRDFRSPALKELLQKLRQLAYGADDALDELEYFRIQDALDGTYHATDVQSQGCVRGLALNARHTARNVAGKLKIPSCSCAASSGGPDGQQDGSSPSSVASSGSSSPTTTNQVVQLQQVDVGCLPRVTSSARKVAHTIGKHFPSHPLQFVHSPTCLSKAPQRNRPARTLKLKFDRVEMSKKIIKIVDQLKPVCAMVSTILNLELHGSNHAYNQHTVANRPKTTPQIIEPELYGRDDQKKNVVDCMTHGTYCVDELTVLPIVGPGGIGKTTFVQHVYQEVRSHFQVSIWICVSLDFNANRLVEEILEKIPKADNEDPNATKEQLIEQRLKSKRFLLVLDDMWTYYEDEWKKLLALLKKGGSKGNIVIVTTRIPEVANMVRTTDCPLELERLDPKDIMSFFEVCVFGDQQPWKDYPELVEVGSKIVGHLKGFPLAAKTVGRLLRNQLTLSDWTRVLESKEWELATSENDIMPALKLSYNYLPFHLQQCFSCCSLFPEDYKFGSNELVHLWIGLDILRSFDHKKRIEDVGLCCLNDLVNHGFLKKNENEDGSPYYVIHDLLHELARNVSMYESVSISSSNIRSIRIPPSVRHLSIIVDNTDVNDRVSFEDYKCELRALDKRLKVENLRTLMLFGVYHGSFAKIFSDLFNEARALRTILLSGVSYTVEDILHNFAQLIHLRYLKIHSMSNKDWCLPTTLFRLYHLEVIDIENWNICFAFTRDMSTLVKLRHFIVPKDKHILHSNISEVGKLKFLQELRAFEVGKESKGFELSQLGQLKEIAGSLDIYNLEKVQAKEEATELKLIHKNYLHRLLLEWDINRSNKDPIAEENVLESLTPPSNLQHLCIRGHGGTNCPTWLGRNLSVRSLESLHLNNVSWKKIPPLGELYLVNELGEECQGCISGQIFKNLKRLELVNIPGLKRWVGNGNCHLLSRMEELIIEDCLQLMELPFSQPICCQPERDTHNTSFPRLQKLKIVKCPNLLSLPPIPWTRTLCSVEIAQAGSMFERIVYSNNDKSESSLGIEGKSCQDDAFWDGLAFCNLTELKKLKMEKCHPLPVNRLEMLSSLKILKICDMSNILSPIECESQAGCPLPVESITILRSGANGKELTELLSHFPNLTKLSLKGYSHHITRLGVASSSSANKPPHAHTGQKGQQETRGGEEEEITSETSVEGGLLLLPPQLVDLEISSFLELSLLFSSSQ